MPKENSKKSIQNTRFEKEARALKKNLEKRKQQEQALKSEKDKKNDSALKLIFYSQNGNI